MSSNQICGEPDPDPYQSSVGESPQLPFSQIPPPIEPSTGRWERMGNGSRSLIGLIIVVTTISIVYRLVYYTGTYRTAVLFILLLAMLAIALTLYQGSSGSALGSALKGTALVFLIGIIILPEGTLCWLLLLPIAVAVVALVGALIDSQSRVNSFLLVPLLTMGFEGVIVKDVIDPNNTVQAGMVVDLTEQQVQQRLAQSPDFDTDLPAFLKIGFAQPQHSIGSELEIGDQRQIAFGDPDNESTMVLEVTERTKTSVQFSTITDSTPMADWVEVGNQTVAWEELDNGQTIVTWKSQYRRSLNPGWYFDPIQQYGMGQSAEYLLAELLR